MTDSNFKRVVRAYMAEHGVNYTTAKRAVESGAPGDTGVPGVPVGVGVAPDVVAAPVEAAAFPFGRVTVACGPDRDAVFEAATAHFAESEGPGRFRHRLDVTGTCEDWSGQVRALRRCDALDEIAVREVGEAPDSAAVVETLVSLAQTGHAVVVSLDVQDLDSAYGFFLDAIAKEHGVDRARVMNWLKASDLCSLDEMLIARNQERQEDHARQVAVGDRVAGRALLNAKEDIAGTKKRMGVFDPAYVSMLDRLTVPFVRMRTATGTPAPTGSFVGGFPYIPAGTPTDEAWPHDEDGPMVFLCQVNFAEVVKASKGGLPGYPTGGLLQWFVGTGDSYGQTYDEPTSGFDGLHVRWYSADDLAAPALNPPVAAPPVDAHVLGPLNDAGPVKVVFRAAKGLPGIIEVSDARTDAGREIQSALDAVESGWGEAEAAGEELPGDLDIDSLYDGTDLGDPNGFGAGDRVGGYPSLVQGDPRAEHPDRAETLLLQLDSDSGFFTQWGDGGSAQLFGDPVALAAGDTGSLWWNWSCH